MKYVYNLLLIGLVAVLASFAIASDELAVQAPSFLDRVVSFFDAWPAWITAITSVVTASSAIVLLTPTKKDDEVLARILKFLNILAMNPKDKRGK